METFRLRGFRRSRASPKNSGMPSFQIQKRTFIVTMPPQLVNSGGRKSIHAAMCIFCRKNFTRQRSRQKNAPPFAVRRCILNLSVTEGNSQFLRQFFKICQMRPVGAINGYIAVFVGCNGLGFAGFRVIVSKFLALFKVGFLPRRETRLYSASTF